MQQLSILAGAGLVSAGVSVALLAGAGTACATADGDSGGAAPSATKGPETKGLGARELGAKGLGPKALAATTPKERPGQPRKPKLTADADGHGRGPGLRTKFASTREANGTESASDTAGVDRHRLGARSPQSAPAAHQSDPSEPTRAKPQTIHGASLASTPQPDRTPIDVTFHVADRLINHAAAQAVSVPHLVVRPAAQLEKATSATPHLPDVLGAIEGALGSVVATVGSAVFTALQSVEAAVTGPPVVPPGSTVTVHTSTLKLDNGESVPANWYFPETADGAPPKQVILLQHGFLAQGPMYSYTAAALAESTGSVVVTPTLSSNPFAGDAYWLGGSKMAESVGHLFEGDRSALTQSALDAGYASAYGLDPTTAELPKQFALVGHSLGANLVSGAAGTLAKDCTPGDCAADDLAGVILFDGVPIGDTLPDALHALDEKEALTGYIPVREIGAPLNAWNSLSSVNEQLTAARPDHFNGVVLDGGVHSDSMSGGNPLIQLALYLAAGFPRPQNPPAVEELSAQWLNDWFAGDTGDGDAHGVVIGTPPSPLLALFHRLVTEFEVAGIGSIPSVDPTLVAISA